MNLHPYRQQGFILIYVVGLVAALALILYQVAARSTGVPNQIERQVEQLLETQEISTLEASILKGLAQEDYPVDPRFLAYRRIQQSDPARLSDISLALQQLRALLSQFNIKVPDRDDPSPNLNNPQAAAAEAIDSSYTFRPQAAPYSITLGERKYQITIRPINALPNLNSIEYSPLWRYLSYSMSLKEEDAKRLAADLIDWRDTDDIRTQGIGAERETYLSAGYIPHNGPIQHWQELAYLRDMTPDRLQTLRTLFNLGPPNASPRVLTDYVKPEAIAALADLKPEFIQAILAEYKKQLTPQTTSASSTPADILFSADSDRFDKTITWQADNDQLRIEILGPHTTLSLTYDAKKRLLLDR